MPTLSPAQKAFKKFKAETAQTVKDRIQALLRQLAILRDVTCFASRYPELGACGGYRKDGELILQFDHLNTRARNISYGDPRLGILVCYRHHFYTKKQYPFEYERCAMDFIGKEREELLYRVRKDNRTYPMGKHDWLLVEIGLKQEIEKLKN
jgi:hypothetical protein